MIHLLLTIFLALTITTTVSADTAPPTPFNGIYIPGQCLSQRRIDKVLHFAPQAGINAVVLHAKDPKGRIYWESRQPLAVSLGASVCRGPFRRAVQRLKARGIWVIAKLDVFIDKLLISRRPDLGVLDNQSREPWKDRHDLHWSNPYDKRVWQYNIELAAELAKLGVDEIQFDYVRFPTDGVLARITYPDTPPAPSKAKTIGAFLSAASKALKPLGATISADLFGLTAWKRGDFGVGQVIEEIAPHVDVICPMLYPSHFPPGFLGWPHPGDYPKEIMDKSIRRLKKRTDRAVRPWIQAFWYAPDEINAQIDGLALAGAKSWCAWNPAGNYATLYRSISERTGRAFTTPQFYPSLEALGAHPPAPVQGEKRIIHYSDPVRGYTLISLESPVPGKKPLYHTLQVVLGLVDEAVMDRILTCRGFRISPGTTRGWKIARLVERLTGDLDLSPRKIRPRPIYVDWSPGGSCRFTLDVPQRIKEIYEELNSGRK